jgi:hypothetical protein
MPWNERRRNTFANRMGLAYDIDSGYDDDWGDIGTRMVLADDAPKYVKREPGIYFEAVAAFQSYGAYREETPEDKESWGGRVFGWEILVPEDAALDDNALLESAAELARDPEFRAKRAALNEWRRELVRYDVSAADVRADLEQRIREYHRAMSRGKVRRTVLNAFTLIAVGTSIAGAVVFPPVAVARGFIAAGRFVADLTLDDPGGLDPSPRAVAVISDARRHFGWH